MATNTQRPSLCCSLLPRITRSMLLRTRLKSLFWIQTVSVLYDLCMLTICKVYESLHHYVMVNVRAVRDIPEVVSAPDPHVTPSRKRVWYLTSEFLVVLSQHVRKTGNPIRLLDLKLSCDKKVVQHGTRMRGWADRI